MQSRAPVLSASNGLVCSSATQTNLFKRSASSNPPQNLSKGFPCVRDRAAAWRPERALRAGPRDTRLHAPWNTCQSAAGGARGGPSRLRTDASASADALDTAAEDLTSQVPIIDIASILPLLRSLEQGDAGAGRVTPEQAACLKQVQYASETWGFFHVINHGVPEDLIQEFLQTSQAFFALPREAKYAVKRTASNSRGYFDDELTKQKRDWKECVDVGAQDGDLDGQSHVDGFNQWPAAPPNFRAATSAYFRAMTGLSMRLLQVLALSLELPHSAFDYTVGAHTSYLRINHYPPFPPEEHPEDATLAALASDSFATALAAPPGVTMGIERHTDAGLLTVLVQDPVSALQVRKADRWHSVASPNSDLHPHRESPAASSATSAPPSTAFTINIGDMLQVLTNDRYVAPLHRVLVNPALDRYSAPFFLNPSYSTDCVPIAEGESEQVYDPVNWGAFRRSRFEGDFADVGTEVQISDFRRPSAPPPPVLQ